MSEDAPGSRRWWQVLGKNTTELPSSTFQCCSWASFFYEGFLWQALYIWHLTCLVREGGNTDIYWHRVSGDQENWLWRWKEEGVSLSFPGIHVLNLCSICFSVLCALLSETKVISLLVKEHSVKERKRRADGDIIVTLFYLNLCPSNKTRWKRFGDEMEPELGNRVLVSCLPNLKPLASAIFILNFIGACSSLSNDEQKFNVRWCLKSRTPSQELSLPCNPSFPSLTMKFLHSQHLNCYQLKVTSCLSLPG